MKKIASIIIILLLLVLIVLKLKENKQISENRVYKYDKEAPIPVFTTEVKKEPVNYQMEITGAFMPLKEVKLNADIQGKIIKYYVKEGQKIRKGQTIAKLDDEILRIQLREIDVQIATFKKDLERYKVLADADAIPAIKLEKTEQGLKTLYQKRNTVLAKIKKTTVKSPFEGIVIKKTLEKGAFAAPGMPLVIISDIDKLKFTVFVPEYQLNLFKIGNEYKITADAYPQLQLKGKVINIGSQGNMSNNFPIQFLVNNTKNQEIKSKMFGKVILDEDSVKDEILIPAKAIIGSEKEPKVYVVKNEKAVLTDIVIGDYIEDKVRVLDGLNPGDQIIISGFVNVFDGANVTIK